MKCDHEYENDHNDKCIKCGGFVPRPYFTNLIKRDINGIMDFLYRGDLTSSAKDKQLFKSKMQQRL